jgi:hypothetical protein
MSYITQRVVKVTLGISNQITISPTNDYRVKQRNKTYTIFIEDGGLVTARFVEMHPFNFRSDLASYIIQAAFNGVPLQLMIEDITNPEIIAVTIPV